MKHGLLLSAVSLGLGLVLGAPARSGAQAPVNLRITGRAIDALSGRGLAGAVVRLGEPAPSSAAGGADTLMTALRATTADGDGHYSIESPGPGTWRLLVSHPGYRARAVTVRPGPEDGTRLSVALEVEPIALQPIAIATSGQASYSGPRMGTDTAAVRRARIANERLRQRRFLSSDVRSITAADVGEAVTLGETDLFRALQRTAGVTTRDDWSAELWTRGAPWHETRVYFDGFPLHDPLHAFGLLGGVHPEIVGSAIFHPGARRAGTPDGATAVLDLTSRPASAGRRATAEFSLASGRLAIEDRFADDRLGLLVTGRRTWIDAFTRLLSTGFDIDDADLPFAFWDIAGRADLDAGAHAFAASALIERDRITGDIPDILHDTHARRGNRIARITWIAPTRRIETRITAGGAWFLERVDTLRMPRSDGLSAPDEIPHDVGFRHLRVSAEVEPRANDAWSAGVALTRERLAYDGPAPFPVPHADPGVRLTHTDELTRGAAWLDVRLRPAPALTADLGLRAETLPSYGGPRIRIAPRATVRLQADDEVALSVGAGRSWQTTQAAGPLGPWVGELAHWGNYWVLAGADMPLLESDVASAGIEAWLSDAWLASATAWARRSKGVGVPDPRPGDAYGRAPFTEAINRARGMEVSARRVAGRWTGSAALSWSRSRIVHDEVAYTAPADRPLGFDATLAFGITSSMRLSTALSTASGASYRRVLTGRLACVHAAPCDPAAAAHIEAMGSRRGSSHTSVDISVDWAGTMFGLRTGAFLQVRNILGRSNQGAYRITDEDCSPGCSDDRPGALRDEFAPGVPLLPLLGFRVVL